MSSTYKNLTEKERLDIVAKNLKKMMDRIAKLEHQLSLKADKNG